MAAKLDPIKEMNIISAGTVVEGKIRSQGSVRVDGKLVGEVTASESLAVGVTGEIDGNWACPRPGRDSLLRKMLPLAEKCVVRSMLQRKLCSKENQSSVPISMPLALSSTRGRFSTAGLL